MQNLFNNHTLYAKDISSTMKEYVSIRTILKNPMFLKKTHYAKLNEVISCLSATGTFHFFLAQRGKSVYVKADRDAPSAM